MQPAWAFRRARAEDTAIPAHRENKLLMAAVVDPKTGIHDKSPHTDQEWAAVRNSAVMLAESGNLLMISPRAKDDDQWMKPGIPAAA